MKKASLKEKTLQELVAELAKLKAAVASATFGRNLGKGGDLKEYRANKKTIARILTLINTR